MITNDEQMAVVREQINRLESALQSLSKSVRPKSEAQFRVMAEGYVDQISSLRGELDAYLGLDEIGVPEIEVALEGPHAMLGDTRISAVTRLMDRFRRALRTSVDAVRETIPAMDKENVTDAFIAKLCDPSLQGVSAGSVRVQLSSPVVEVGKSLYDSGLELLKLAILSVAGDEAATKEFSTRDFQQQAAALTAAKMLTPEVNSDEERVGLRGRFLGESRSVQFDYSTRQKIQQRLGTVMRQTVPKTVKGQLREVDLDRRLFSLRDRDTGKTIERCRYGKRHDADVAKLLDQWVEVTGTRRVSVVRATRLRVKNILPISGAA